MNDFGGASTGLPSTWSKYTAVLAVCSVASTGSLDRLGHSYLLANLTFGPIILHLSDCGCCSGRTVGCSIVSNAMVGRHVS